MHLKKYLLFTFLLLNSFLIAQTAEHDAYIENFYKIAVAEMDRAGIPASIKLAQGILESGIGKSELAKNANNHFGIKCGGEWVGETYYIIDDDRDASGKLIKSCFRVFETPEESYIEHTEFLSDPKKAFRYGALFKLDKTDYEGWANGLKKAGYATNPNYPKLLITVIKNNDLAKYDVMTLADLDGDFTENYPNQRENIKNKRYTKVNDFNKVDFAYAKEGDTPQDVANRFNVSTRNLLQYNEIEGIKVFENNERVYLENKRTRYSSGNKLHRVQEGETMESIAQRYAMKTKWLYWRNRIKENETPISGQQLKLRGWNFDDVKTVPKGTNTKPQSPSKPQGNTNNNANTTPSESSENDGYLDEIVPPSVQKIKHTVKKGDTLYGIARQYGVPVDKIKELNNLTSNVLNIGQELIIK